MTLEERENSPVISVEIPGKKADLMAFLHVFQAGADVPSLLICDRYEGTVCCIVNLPLTCLWANKTSSNRVCWQADIVKLAFLTNNAVSTQLILWCRLDACKHTRTWPWGTSACRMVNVCDVCGRNRYWMYQKWQMLIPGIAFFYSANPATYVSLQEKEKALMLSSRPPNKAIKTNKQSKSISHMLAKRASISLVGIFSIFEYMKQVSTRSFNSLVQYLALRLHNYLNRVVWSLPATSIIKMVSS